jgi:hypothetical protein
MSHSSDDVITWNRVTLGNMHSQTAQKNSPHFMRPERSSPYSQHSASTLYLELFETNPYHNSLILNMNYSNIILPSTSRSFNQSLSFRSDYQLFAFLIYSMRATCPVIPTHLSFLSVLFNDVANSS